MKEQISILLAGIILIASMSNAVVYLSFKINQVRIAEAFCINKSKPSLHCEGKCFLQERLAQSNDRENQSSPFKHFEETVRLTFFCQLPEMLVPVYPHERYHPVFRYAGLLTQPYLKSFLHPPEAALFTS